MNRFSAVVLLAIAVVSSVPAQSTVTSPKQAFGFEIGADYHLVNYSQLEKYWQTLARESKRVRLERIGTSAEGRAMWTVIVSSPENIASLDKYQSIVRRLAHAEGLDDSTAHALAAEGRAVVWIDGGLHASEVLGAQQLIETVYELVSRSDPEILRFLNDDIVLCTLVNPDGMELVSNWYNRNPDSTKRSTSALPRLYQKYVGHDNNRDFYMANQPETQAIDSILYRAWYPQIVYNHHQTGPAGTVMFAPPFRDPFNYTYDPLVPMELDLVGAAMHTRFEAEGKPGVTMRSGSSYSTWWNGGLRTMVYFHNQIGLLTETIGNPTPVDIPFVPQNALPRGDLPYPIAPQRWHFRQSIDYSLTANWAVLDVASRYRETFLYNTYVMGRNAIARGSKDTWTTTPRDIDSVVAQVQRDRPSQPSPGGGQERLQAAITPFGSTVPASYYDVLRRPDDRDPRGYIIRSDQPDFLTATKFVNALIRGGVDVDRATREFTVNGVRYPAGSYVVRTAQAFRPHVLDMFEAQNHPTDLQYPGGPPKPPYDNAGWTLAYQMGVRFDRVLDAFDAPTERITGVLAPPRGSVAPSRDGWLLRHSTNDAIRGVNRLLARGASVYWLSQPATIGGKGYAAGTFYVARSNSARALLPALADSLGLVFDAGPSRPPEGARKLSQARIGLWDRYGGSTESGWVRWLLEQYEFPYTVVYPQQLDSAQLRSRFDVLVFVDGAIPHEDRPGEASPDEEFTGRQPKPEDIPAEYRARLGYVTVGKTVPQISRFLHEGGRVVTIGSSANLVYPLGLPVTSALVEMVNGQPKPLPHDKYYVPGSVLRATVDTTLPVAAGVGRDGVVDVFFDNSPVFRLGAPATAQGVRAIAWFDGPRPLRSGWALGQAYLDQGIAAFEAPVGSGTLYVLGPEITFRGQPHGTFKLLFNALELTSRSSP